jgi:adenylate cyclase
LHVAEEAGLLPPSDVPGQLRAAVVFIDLSSFTPLAEAMGDATAADVLERFSRMVRTSVAAYGGRIVKQIGDAFMLVFQDARSAVACTLEIDAEAAKEPQFPAVRAGMQWGDLLYREGDYVGSNVNIAARLASEADRHQVLVTADVRKEAAGTPGIEFSRLGKRALKGLGGRFELFTARRTGEDRTSEKQVDPVCGMDLRPEEIAARLTIEGEERAFCSEACLRRFVATPEQYATQRTANS